MYQWDDLQLFLLVYNTFVLIGAKLMKKIFVFLSIVVLLLQQNIVFSSEVIYSDYLPTSLYNDNVNSVVYVQTQDSSGSGVLLKEDGTFVTCFHVIANADYIFIKLEDGSIYYVNGFRYINPLTDVAILTLDTKRKFKPILPENAKQLKIGEKVYVISNPQGIQFVFTDGMINQYNKDYIQFSAPISSGSSGGALLNSKGHLVGIITSQFDPSAAQNINFALPNHYFIDKINVEKITNGKNLKWTEFLVENADKQQFRSYADFALNQSNFSMFYKYLQPFLVRYDVPEDLYQQVSVLAFYAYLFDGMESNLADSIKYLKFVYERNLNEELALCGLSLIPIILDASIDTTDYVVALYQKYPRSYNKLSELINKMDGCSSVEDTECFSEVIVEYAEYLFYLLDHRN